MTRTKEISVTKNVAARQGSFTFRRIQSRELYQPAHEADGGNARILFRVRVNLPTQQSS